MDTFDSGDTMFWRTVGRLVLVPVAFLLAAIAAAAVVLTLGLERITHAMTGTPEGAAIVEFYANILLAGLDLMAGVSIVPALAVVIIGEVAGIRSWLYYVIGGGLALASIPFLAGLGHAGPDAMPPAALWQVLATAGFAGGLVYWLLAGRRA